MATDQGENWVSSHPEVLRGRSNLDSPDGLQNSYEPPSVSDLQKLMSVHSGNTNHLDEVWPRIYIGDMWAAKAKRKLQSLSITHVLNAADVEYVSTGPSFYEDTSISYHGVEAFDMPDFDMSPFFDSSAKFIQNALSAPGVEGTTTIFNNTFGVDPVLLSVTINTTVYCKVLVHCAMGRSRSATLVLAYLMICEDLTLSEAATAIAKHRSVSPNPGFLEQLRRLDLHLHGQRRLKV